MTHFRLTIFLLFAFSFNSAEAQNTSERLDTLVQEFVHQLIDKKIDTICVYQKYCVGYDMTWNNEKDRCNYGSLFVSTYIIWLDNGKTFMTKKDNCFDYSTIEFRNKTFWDFYFSNKDTLAKEILKMPQFIEVVEGKKQIYSPRIEHSCYKEIKVFLKELQIDKEIDEYYFEKEIGLAKSKNINYEYNTNSYLKRFQTKIEETIAKETKIQVMTKDRR